MKKVLVIIAVISISALIISCKKGDDHGHQHGPMTTKIVVVNGIQVAFDLMDQEGHEKMMTAMNVPHRPAADLDRFVSITLMNKADMTLVKGAKVLIKVTGPNNKSQEQSTHIMEGSGMYHYGAGFTMKEQGDYKVTAAITIEEKELTAETDFTIK